MKVIVRADASDELGSGHVMRCLALAGGLRDRGVQVVFVCRAAAGDLCEFIAAVGYPVHKLSVKSGVDWHEDAALTIEVVVREAPVDWVIVDHYDLALDWESALRPHTVNLMVIDDLANRVHDCDLLLDQNHLSDGATRYLNKVPEFCTLLLGSRFALLRPEFAATRPCVPRDQSAVGRVFVFLSGVDPHDVTGRVLRVLDDVIGTDVEVDIALGTRGKHIEALRRYCAGRVGRHLHIQTSRLAELLGQADIAIGAGGASSLERACLGVPSIVLTLADNQLKIAETLGCVGAHLYLGRIEYLHDSTLRDALRVLLENRYLRTSLSRTSFSITDGHGVARVVRRLVRVQMSIRPAVVGDCDQVFSWRNHPDTRRHFFDATSLDLLSHQKWFGEVLADQTRMLLIGGADARDLGVLRYDFNGNEARVSIYLDPAYHGEGYGPMLLAEGVRWLKAHRPDVRTIIADVLPSNERSLQAFLAVGFRETHHCLRLDLTGLDSSTGDGILMGAS